MYTHTIHITQHRLGATSLSGGVLPLMAYMHGVAPPERGTFFRLRLYEREGISLDDENKRAGKSFIYLRSVKRRKRAKY